MTKEGPLPPITTLGDMMGISRNNHTGHLGHGDYPCSFLAGVILNPFFQIGKLPPPGYRRRWPLFLIERAPAAGLRYATPPR